MMVGRLVALTYLLCVLAPAAALALGSGPAPCLDSVHAAAVHDRGTDNGPVHAHGGIHVEAAHQHGTPAHPPVDHKEHHEPGKAALGPCCALMCISAMPAELPSLAAPSLPVSTCLREARTVLHSEAPSLLYRPPIA